MLSEKFEYEFPMLEECPSFGTFAAGFSGQDNDDQFPSTGGTPDI